MKPRIKAREKDCELKSFQRRIVIVRQEGGHNFSRFCETSIAS